MNDTSRDPVCGMLPRAERAIEGRIASKSPHTSAGLAPDLFLVATRQMDPESSNGKDSLLGPREGVRHA